MPSGMTGSKEARSGLEQRERMGMERIKSLKKCDSRRGNRAVDAALVKPSGITHRKIDVFCGQAATRRRKREKEEARGEKEEAHN